MRHLWRLQFEEGRMPRTAWSFSSLVMSSARALLASLGF